MLVTSLSCGQLQRICGREGSWFLRGDDGWSPLALLYFSQEKVLPRFLERFQVYICRPQCSSAQGVMPAQAECAWPGC